MWWWYKSTNYLTHNLAAEIFKAKAAVSALAWVCQWKLVRCWILHFRISCYEPQHMGRRAVFWYTNEKKICACFFWSTCKWLWSLTEEQLKFRRECIRIVLYPTEKYLWEDFIAFGAAVHYWATDKFLQELPLWIQSVNKMSAAPTLCVRKLHMFNQR